MPSCDWPTVCFHDKPVISDPRSYMPKYTDQLTLKQMHDQQITYLSSNQRRTHTLRFLCCFTVTIASNIEACAYLSSAIFCHHCRDVRSDVCHGSTISSADFLRKLNHAHKSWSTLSIVWFMNLVTSAEVCHDFLHFHCDFHGGLLVAGRDVNETREEWGRGQVLWGRGQRLTPARRPYWLHLHNCNKKISN